MLIINNVVQKILTHSKSRVVFEAMKEASISNKSFEVYVTTSAPNNSGYDINIYNYYKN